MIGTIIGAVGFVIYFIIGWRVWIVAIWQRIASSTGVSSPTWSSTRARGPCPRRTAASAHCAGKHTMVR
jgi:hypothetical protein